MDPERELGRRPGGRGRGQRPSRTGAEALGLSDAEVQRLKASAPVRTLRCLVIRPGTGDR